MVDDARMHTLLTEWVSMTHIHSYHDDVIKWKHFMCYWPFACPSQSPVTRSFDAFFDLRLNKRSSKHSIRRWFETPSRSLWRHCNVTSNIIRHCSDWGRIYIGVWTLITHHVSDSPALFHAIVMGCLWLKYIVLWRHPFHPWYFFLSILS